MLSLLFHALLFIAPAAAAPPGWESLGVTAGVEVARKSMPDSSLFAFRGEADVDVPIGVLAEVLWRDGLSGSLTVAPMDAARFLSTRPTTVASAKLA